MNEQMHISDTYIIDMANNKMIKYCAKMFAVGLPKRNIRLWVFVLSSVNNDRK